MDFEFNSNISAYVSYLNTDYFTNLHQDLCRAKKSIFITQYVINFKFYKKWYRSTKIVEALFNKKTAGLDVRLILDSPSSKKPNHKPNFFAYKRFTERKIPVKCLLNWKSFHAKTFIIDDEIVYSGSHNLTDLSLSNPFEFSFRVSDPLFTAASSKWFLDLWDNPSLIPFKRKLDISYNGES